ncbi:MAG: ABC transporter substrate-binding protein [Dehalococcoidia bacterium]|nr:ABC transporter substrate-binding protein [Dehalococcoidia bacterium]
MKRLKTKNLIVKMGKAWLLVAVAIAMLLSACAPTAVPSPAAPKKLTKLRAGEPPAGFFQAFTMMGLEKGFAKEEGLDIEVTYAAEGDLVKALVSGQLDMIANVNPFTGFSAIEQGASMILVGATVRPRDTLYVKKEINNVKDLEGRSIASSGPGRLTHALELGLLDKYKVDKNKVDIVSVGGDSDRMAALLAGKVDATVAGIENMSIVEKTPSLKALLTIRDALPEFALMGGIFPGDKLVKEQPEVVQGYVNTVARGIRYAYEHKDETVALAMKLLKTEDKAAMERAYDDNVKNKFLPANLEFTDEVIKGVQDYNVSANAQKAVLPFDKIATRKFQEAMIAKLGEYKYK